jgi:glutamine cyclotransferase
MRLTPVFLAFTLLTTGDQFRPVPSTPRYTYRIVRVYPHDASAFTEGLFYRNGMLYEGTGIKGRSRLRKTELATGRVLQEISLPATYYGEGIAWLGDRLFQLTWQSQLGFIYDVDTLRPSGTFRYPGEGWGLASSASEFFLSDGTTVIRCLDPSTLAERRRFTVHDGPHPIGNLNELEYIDRELFANIWFADRIVRIDPSDGRVLGWIDLDGLMPAGERPNRQAVLNGIAWDASGRRLFVTGKMWPKLFDIELVEKTPR